MTVAGMSMSGIPFTIGFISKTMLEEAAVEGGATWMAILAVLCSAFTFAGIGLMLWRLFMRDATERTAEQEFAPATAAHRGAGEAHPLMLVAMAIPVLLSIAAGVLPWLPLRWFAEPVAAALLQPAAYARAVLQPAGVPAAAPLIIPELHAPSLLNWAVWPALIFIVTAGSALAYFSLPKNEQRFWAWPPIDTLYRLIRRWHSGSLSDYVLWNAFGTSILLVLFVLVFALKELPGS
jgi:NADH:ubiquinone oxidoreductase subunit 5 (subunit L)/multisubunit Na+/H+ antiporter MnhA subunit